MKLIAAMSMLATALLGIDLRTETVTPTVAAVVPSEVPTTLPVASTTTTTTTTAPDTTNRAEPTILPVQVSSIRIIPGIDDAEYPEWWPVALDAGWPTDLLPTLDLVMYRESRGQPDVVGTGAYGLLQLQWSAHREWITATGVTDREQLFDPALNLQLGWMLYQMADEMYGCGWQPWYMSLNDPHSYC